MKKDLPDTIDYLVLGLQQLFEDGGGNQNMCW